ncbi:sugar/pyridoxal phosphate phosphatase YigL [Chimaeribacter arupi]|uniref:Sugar/pyridoxal phosphate phosphatase YigL n=1 Tax=Nissabacter archeti TaxID=1917880 RepID=A0ABS5JMF3_9GAMM|nr:MULTISPECIES: sugar/pyridoxal phosphate phosphatase YigL [Yersiniaceae]MBS0971041.1 sugar/pyridoxal phosphate phosphatase YigL [Nissabacter archeti]MDV5141776.1 sugar/pyridoxal phosphate phosphatase YigL [Chimaeribacter arupi]PLR32309.1 sugar/pyridoxal phosphate phosphatase YigL [Chimaeribacter arupi]PLR43283.1 sugar/pyridoxal phosphate phosphatase YigL [Chimaeribacter arupi]PLR46302.1 sugar/pyridoxal phosphate phosphatase YigL [Chimaeribacter arupi]
MYHVVASDLDGTLLSPDHTLTPYAKETLKLLTRQGIHFVFATGRHHVDVGQIRDNLEISAFMITSNGARVHNTEGELIFSHNLDGEIARDLYGIVHDNPKILTNVYRNDDWFMNRDRPDQDEFFQESVFKYTLFEPTLLETDGICKVYFTCEDHDELLQLEETINARWGERVNVSFSFPTCLEVMAGGVSKGHALEQVAALAGYSLADCIAFGDGMNDFEMLSVAGKGCVMRDAHQRLKDRLPHLEVIGSNVDDAVPHYLRKMYLSDPA